MVFFIDTCLGKLSMPLIVAMAMENLEIADSIGATIFFEDQVVDLHEVSVFEVQSTEPALSFLISQ